MQTTPRMNVPFLDLKVQYEALKPEITVAIAGVLDAQQYIQGPAVASFEKAFAAYCEAQHCVAAGSGTDALHLAFLAHGIGKGDEVITQANTFIATVEAIDYVGARPVFVDVDPERYLIDVAQIERAITDKTRAIVPVHLFGHPCDLDPIYELARKRNLVVIEDASQAHGARYKGARIGSRGTACFSFYPGKNLGAYGEGGAVVTPDAELAARMQSLRSHGSAVRYVHDVIGYNYRMDGIQGAVLGVKLPHLDRWNEGRRRVAAAYDALLSPAFRKPIPADSGESVYHIYPILVNGRDRAREILAEAGIETNVHYPIACHLQKACADLGYAPGAFPVSERLAATELSLPMYPEMSQAAIEYVAGVVNGLPQP